ncbi:MAG: glycosyltransferase [Anaerolineaceae bacterium]|nr:glycosyltransferase [Anaerolineaceae bacterium]
MICHKSPQGAYSRSHVMAANLVKRGHRVTLLMVSRNAHWRTSEYDWEGVRAIESPNLSFGRLRFGWDLWNTTARLLFLRKEKPIYELIHCFETRPATIYPALWYSRKHQLPLITDWNDWFGRRGLISINRPGWYHTFHFEEIETYYEEHFRTRAAGLTVISTALFDRAVRLGVRPENICHIPGGTFLDWFTPRSKEECRRRLGYPLETPILGFSSSDSHFDMEIVMSALAIVARKFPAIKLIVTGKARKSVYDLVKKNRVQDQVYFVGYVPFEELPWYLGCADAFLLPMADLPYNRGRWPNKMGEYMSLGRPTVANPVGDIKALFETYPVGCLAAWDPEDFANKILLLLENSELSEGYGKSARLVAETKYDWKVLIGRLEEFYSTILDQREKKVQRGEYSG